MLTHVSQEPVLVTGRGPDSGGVPPLAPGRDQLPSAALRAALPEGVPAGPAARAGRPRAAHQAGTRSLLWSNVDVRFVAHSC